MKKKVILYTSIPKNELDRLREHFDVTVFNQLNDANRAEFNAALVEAHGIIGSGVVMSDELLDTAPYLKAVSTISVGIDQFGFEYLSQRKIALMHTPGVLNETVADTVILLALGTARRAVEVSNMVREGGWDRNLPAEYFGVDLHHKKMGIVGMGRIGYAVAKRAHLGFGMSICYHNRSANLEAERDFAAQRLELNELLSTCDFVVALVPLSAATEKMFGKEQFELMKSSAIFVNAARGKVVDESALIEALKNKTIRAAGLDVFEVEPLPASSPLNKLDNALLLPHIGSATTETRYKMVQCAVDNIIAALNGDYSANCANKAQIES